MNVCIAAYSDDWGPANANPDPIAKPGAYTIAKQGTVDTRTNTIAIS